MSEDKTFEDLFFGEGDASAIEGNSSLFPVKKWTVLSVQKEKRKLFGPSSKEDDAITYYLVSDDGDKVILGDYLNKKDGTRRKTTYFGPSHSDDLTKAYPASAMYDLTLAAKSTLGEEAYEARKAKCGGVNATFFQGDTKKNIPALEFDAAFKEFKSFKEILVGTREVVSYLNYLIYDGKINTINQDKRALEIFPDVVIESPASSTPATDNTIDPDDLPF